MLEATQFKGDEDYFATLAREAPATMQWIAAHGVPFHQPTYYLAKGPPRIQPVGGGAELVGRFVRIAKAEGVDIRYACGAEELVVDNGRVAGVIVSSGDKRETLPADAVVLATGGFQAMPR
jgi:tricarballylate dehydrogenase